MKYAIRLLNYDEKRERLIAKRISGDKNIDVFDAQFLLKKLPIEVFETDSEMHLQNAFFDYKRLGCTVEKINKPNPVNEEKKIEEPEHQKTVSIKKPVFKPHTYDFKTSPNIKENKKEKKSTKFRDTVILISIIFVFAILLFIVQKYSNPDFSNKGKSKVNSSVSKRQQNSDQKDSYKNQKHVNSLIESAEKAQNINKKKDLLTKALKKNPSNKRVKQKLSSVYAKKANSVYSNDSKIKFYKIAISFNKYNEKAWQGLINTYYSSNQYDLAKKTQKEKTRVFKQVNRELSRLISSFSDIIGIPKINNSSLSFTYRTKEITEDNIKKEMMIMADKIKGIRNFKQITIQAKINNKTIKHTF